jgi:hypothetical protein
MNRRFCVTIYTNKYIQNLTHRVFVIFFTSVYCIQVVICSVCNSGTCENIHLFSLISMVYDKVAAISRNPSHCLHQHVWNEYSL